MVRRALFALLLFSGLAFGQTLSGSWSTKISLLPPPVALSSTEFELFGTVAGWKVGGRAEFFGTDGWVWQTLMAQGEFRSISSEWTLLFGPLAPAFLYALGKTTFAYSGLDLTLWSAMVGPNVPPYVFTGGPSGGTVLELGYNLEGVRVSGELGFGARKQDFTLIYSGVGTYTKTFPVDPFPGGFEFRYLKLSAEDVPFCCGISLDLGFSFTKEGFDEFSATLKSIPICCGISFDASVTFTTTQKTIAIKPKWEGITGCFTVYGDVNFQEPGAFQGIEVYGFKVRCELAECNYLEILTAFDPAKVEEMLGEEIFQNDEFEYVKLGFCGPGCCGGNWQLDLSAYFTRSGGALFGLSRILADFSLPIMANLTVDVGLSAPVGGLASLTVGWTFTF